MAVIWALVLGFWFSFGPKSKRDIRLVPGFAAILLALGAIGAEILSVGHQKSRAIVGMKTAGIMSEDGIILPRDEIEIQNEDAARKAKGSLAYLTRQNETKTLNRLFEGAEDKPDFDKFDSAVLMQRLALENISVSSGEYNGDRNLTFTAKNTFLDISNYDRLYGPLNYYSSVKPRDKIVYQGEALQVWGNGFLLEFSYNNEPLIEFDIEEWVGSLPIIDGVYVLAENPVVIYQNETEQIAISFRSINRWDMSGSNKEPMNISLEFNVLTSGF